MSDWTGGYVADIGYTFGYYQELNPLRLKLAFLHAGLAFPEVGTACELGFGQGMSVNLHAAATVTQWHGTDFNPAQAGFAQELATASGAQARLHDDAFADFAQRSDLPEFDYIGLHGIWSWISDDNRAQIVDFVRRKLKVGGVLYISYNALPGWSTFAPMRHLMTQHAIHLGTDGGGVVNRVNGAIDFAEKLLGTNPLYARANPQVPERLAKLKPMSREYLAHEYFNRDWHPMYVADMAEWLAPAKLNYACSAHLLDQIDPLNLSPEQQALLKEVPDPLFRETVRDYMVNQQFRRDYWVKGARRMTQLDQVEQLRQLRVVLVTPRADVSLKVNGALGEAAMADAVYQPVLAALADHKVHTLAQVEPVVAAQGVTLAQMVQAVVVLAGAGHIAPAQDEALVPKAKRSTDKLNAHLLQRARGNTDVTYLASPVTGGGVSVDRIAQLFLLARSQGHKQPADWVAFTWKILASQNQRLLKDGKAIETEEGNLAELQTKAQAFADKQLPVLKALMVV